MGGEQSSYSVSSCVEHIRSGRRIADVANFDFRDLSLSEDNYSGKHETESGKGEMTFDERDMNTSETERRGCGR